MTVVTMPDNTQVDFGNLPPDQIRSLIQQKFPDAVKAAPSPGGATPAAAATPSPSVAPTPSRGGLMDVLGGLASLLNPVAAAGQAAAGNPAMNAAAQGMTAGFSDEIGGVAGGAIDAATGGSFSEGYDRTTGKARGELEKFRQGNPVAATALEAGGALMTAPVAGAVNVVRAPAAANALVRGGAALTNAAATGAAYGGAYGAGTAEGGGIYDRLTGGLEGAGLGAATGAAALPLVGGLTAIGSKLFGKPAQAVATATGRPVAERQVAAAVQKDAATQGVTPDEAVGNIIGTQQAGLPTALADVGEATRSLGRAAADISPQGRNVLNQTLEPRHATQADRVIDTLANYAPGMNAPGTLRVLKDAAERTNRTRYNTAYAKGAAGIWTPELEALTGSREVQSAIRDAVRRGQSEGVLRGQSQVKSPFVEGPNGTLVPAPGVKPTLEFWDQVQRSLRDLGKRQSGERMAENAALYDRLRGRLNSVLDKAVPEFNDARLGAFRFFGAEDAMEAGVNFARMRGDVLKMDEARQALANMTQAQRSLFSEGYASQFVQDVNSIRDSGKALSVIDRVFNSKVARKQFELALGPQAHDAMEATVRLERILQDTRSAIQGGSHTAQYQLAAQALMGTAAGAGGLYLSGGDWSTAAITAVLTGLAARGAGAAGRNVMQRTNEINARRVAELLASNDPQVVREAMRRVASNPTWMENIRAAHARLARALIPVTQGGSAAAPAMVDTGTGSQPAQADQ